MVPVKAKTLPPPPVATSAAFPTDLAGTETAYDRIGPGDRLNLRIWESGTATIFGGASGASDLGEITVDESGNIHVPYAGTVKAAGLTVSQVRDAISRRLRTVVLN